MARAEGAWLETTDGRRVLDFTSGQICSTRGHNHPRIVEALRRALDGPIHLNSWMLSEPVLSLGERLARLFPSPLDRVCLLNTGSEANEVALKLAKMHTGRFEIVGLTRSFHGLLAGIASVNFSMAHAGYGPLLPGAFAVPAPYARGSAGSGRCSGSSTTGSCPTSSPSRRPSAAGSRSRPRSPRPRSPTTASERGSSHVTSHVSDPLPAAAGLAVLDVIEEEGLVARARSRGEYLLARLRELQGEHEHIGDVRGRGLLVGLEVVADRGTKAQREPTDCSSRSSKPISRHVQSQAPSQWRTGQR